MRWIDNYESQYVLSTIFVIVCGYKPDIIIKDYNITDNLSEKTGPPRLTPVNMPKLSSDTYEDGKIYD